MYVVKSHTPNLDLPAFQEYPLRIMSAHSNEEGQDTLSMKGLPVLSFVPVTPIA